MYVITYSYSCHARTLVTWKAPQTTARMSVNVFNLLNGSYKSKHWQKRGERTRAHCSLQNDYLLGLAKCEATPIIGDPGLLLFGGPIFTDPIPIFYIPFLQLRWIWIFSNVRRGQGPLGPFRRIATDSNNIHTGHYSVTNSLTADNQFAKCSIQCFPLI